MRKLFFTLTCSVILSNVLFAQMEEKIKEQMWGQAPAEFKVTQVPEKWKNESAVLLVVEEVNTLQRNGTQMTNTHCRIKLLDKAAVKQFSEMSFDNNAEVKTMWGRTTRYRMLGIKVIKENGTEKILDLKAAVKQDAGSNSNLKIPVPDLEPGDILDYYQCFLVTGDMEYSDYEVLELKYPVVSHIFRFTMYDKLVLNSTSFNGAPEMKQTTDADGILVYTLEDRMRNKAPDILWSYPYRTAPNFRYTIKNKKATGTVKGKAMEDLKFYEKSPVPAGSIALIEDYMKENFKKEKDSRKIACELYELLRNPMYMRIFCLRQQGDPLGMDFPNPYFVALHQSLKRMDVDHKFIYASSVTKGPFADLVNMQSTDLILKINTQPAIYITRPTAFSTPDEIAYVFEGTDAVTPGSKDSLEHVPSSTMEQNATDISVNIALDNTDMAKLNVERNIVAKGHAKNYHQDLIVTNYDYLKAYDQPKYQAERSHLITAMVKGYAEQMKKLEQRLTTDYNERDKKIISALESDMDVKVTGYKINLRKIGMWAANPVTEYSEKFTIENASKTAGQNKIIELGKLIGQQVEINEAQKIRTRDIYMSYARLFTFEITFAIPDGYTIEGIDNFNMKVENTAGGFESVAKMEGKNIVIHAKKYYVKNYYPATDWDKITAFTQSANNFYNAKILLKKAS